MSKKSIIVLLAFVFSYGGVAAAAGPFEVTWLYVQHRVNEDPAKGTFNRLCFLLQDDAGNYASTPALLEDVMLVDPNGSILTLTDPGFDPGDYYGGSYDDARGQWYYNPTQLHEPTFYYKITEPLPKGIYYLFATYDGYSSECSYLFNGEVALPMVESSSFQIPAKLDASGALIINWTPSAKLFHFTDSNPKIKTSARAEIDAYQGSTYTGYLIARVSTHLGRFYVPKSVLSQLSAMGDRFEFRAQLRTNDNSNRTYSKFVDITNLISPP